MNNNALLRAHVCLTATTSFLFAGAACGNAFASQNHTLKHGETVESLARRYHVPLKYILAANHLKPSSILHPGHKVHIPDAPRAVIVPRSMHKAARIKGDGIIVRSGPGSSHSRMDVYEGGTKLVITGERDGWYQVTLPGGHSGWVRSDFVAHRAAHGPKGLAQNAPRKHHEERHSLREAAARIREHKQEQSRARQRMHAENLARETHRRHLLEAAAARHRSHAAKAAEHHHAAVAAEHHRKRLADIAQATHEKHLKAIAQARHHKRLAEMAAAKHRKHLAEIAAAHRDEHHSASSISRHDKRVAEMAEIRHRKRLKEIAEAQRQHHDHEAAQARHERHLHEIAVARHRHHLEAQSAAHRKHLAAIAEHKRHAQAAWARRHENGHYAHRIRPEAESPSASNDVVRSAYAYRGTPYRWGESRPGGFDCSGFTKYIYGRKGVALPRTAAEQYHAGRAVGHRGMKPGDLVFFHTTRSGISHVGMYVGNGKFVHSSSKKQGGVRVDNLESGYYSKAFRGARRVRKDTNEPSGE